LVLKANVSEPSIGSIFMGRWMKNDWDGACVVFIPEGVVVGKWPSQWESVTGWGGWSHNRLWKGEACISVRVVSLLCTQWLPPLLESM